MEEAKKDIIIRTGDKVITADGRVGRVTSVCECEECARRGFFEPAYKINGDPDEHYIMIGQYQAGFPDFYLIGKNFFGNKINPEEIERRIAEQRAIIEKEQEKLDLLRKQLWTLNEKMVSDWREREESRHKAAEERRAKKAAEQAEVEKSPEQNA